jgi:hypothetical protein
LSDQPQHPITGVHPTLIYQFPEHEVLRLALYKGEIYAEYENHALVDAVNRVIRILHAEEERLEAPEVYFKYLGDGNTEMISLIHPQPEFNIFRSAVLPIYDFAESLVTGYFPLTIAGEHARKIISGLGFVRWKEYLLTDEARERYLMNRSNTPVGMLHANDWYHPPPSGRSSNTSSADTEPAYPAEGLPEEPYNWSDPEGYPSEGDPGASPPSSHSEADHNAPASHHSEDDNTITILSDSDPDEPDIGHK